MKIGLIDVDGHNFPNLALMKLSAYHKAKGDSVEFYNHLNGKPYDKVYCSKVFSFTPDIYIFINAKEVVRGGTGYALHGAGGEDYQRHEDTPLPEEIEHIYPDYSLYRISDTAYGFLTRGCPRGCDFCIVAKKEGRCSRKVADLNEFWHGQKHIVLCDPNILACPEWKDLLQQLADSRASVDFNQGLDIRLVTEEKIEALNAVKVKEIHFAWDRYDDKDLVLPKLQLYSEMALRKPHSHNSIVYVLVNHGSTLEQDLERIYTLREMGYWAYVMIYDKAHADHIYSDLARWCNNRFIFARCPRFEDYNKRLPPPHHPQPAQSIQLIQSNPPSHMPQSQVHNTDCITFMKSLPDNFFSLAIADPPYGLDKKSTQGSGKLKNRTLNRHDMQWDVKPPQDFFDQLCRVSKHQIIWGGNYFDLGPTRCFICWDKQQVWPNFSQCEYAWTSFDKPAKLVTISNRGGHIDAIDWHPTVKPVQLYAYCLNTFAIPCDTIFDPMMGSQSSRIAAYKLGFDYVGCELDKEYFAKGCERFDRECQGITHCNNGKTLIQTDLFST